MIYMYDIYIYMIYDIYIFTISKYLLMLLKTCINIMQDFEVPINLCCMFFVVRTCGWKLVHCYVARCSLGLMRFIGMFLFSSLASENRPFPKRNGSFPEPPAF